MKEHSCKLCSKAFAFALGIVWGVCTLILGWTAMFGWGNSYVDVMTSIYIGYDASFIGGIIGGIWGFVIGAIFGYVIAYIYNYVVVRETPAKKK